VLLTVDDVTRRAHYRNAYRTLRKLLDLGVLPIVNENDTVATDEIRFGDNDRLAALVAHLVHADLLVLLSDVDGSTTATPQARHLADRRRSADEPTCPHVAIGSGQGRRRHRRHGHQGRGRPDRDRPASRWCSPAPSTRPTRSPARSPVDSSTSTPRRSPS
jgi:hypothetical protein